MDIDHRRSESFRHLRDAIVTVAVILLAFAAFDDITTDNATAFRFEYSGLAACGAWLLYQAVRLIRDRHLALGGGSLLALFAAVWGQFAIGPGTVPSADAHYLATAAAFGWFAALSAALLVRGWRSHLEVQAQPHG